MVTWGRGWAQQGILGGTRTADTAAARQKACSKPSIAHPMLNNESEWRYESQSLKEFQEGGLIEPSCTVRWRAHMARACAFYGPRGRRIPVARADSADSALGGAWSGRTVRTCREQQSSQGNHAPPTTPRASNETNGWHFYEQASSPLLKSAAHASGYAQLKG